MNMLIEEVQTLATDWRSWVVIGVMALLALVSLFQAIRCPLLMGTHKTDPKTVDEAKIIRKNIGLRFAFVMMAGFALTLTGLLMITYGVKPTLALAAMVLGLVIIQTEPARMKIREARRTVLAAGDGPEDTQKAARGRLRGSYRELAAINLGILVCLTGAMVAF